MVRSDEPLSVYPLSAVQPLGGLLAGRFINDADLVRCSYCRADLSGL